MPRHRIGIVILVTAGTSCGGTVDMGQRQDRAILCQYQGSQRADKLCHLAFIPPVRAKGV